MKTIKPEIRKRLEIAVGSTPLHDWKFKTVNLSSTKCECGQGIHTGYVFTNGTKDITVGSTCRYYFPDYIIANILVKISKDPSKSIFNDWLVISLENQGIINEWESNFYIDTIRKRKLSVKQLKCRYRINKKICKYYGLTCYLEDLE